jgi:uracil-DNA glycosylase family 4
MLAFDHLVEEVHQCRVCPRMEGRRRLLSRANGALQPRVLFIAEAPGRLGGDRTAVPLAGDQSGRNFERLLAAAGLGRDEIFITNAVLCNPRDAAGRNAPPSEKELNNCSRHLAATLHVVQPSVVVTLGAVALRALQRLHPHELLLARDVGQAVRWDERWLMPLYHPGPRAQLHRDFAQQADDFRQLATFLQGLEREDAAD